ncbi:MAG: hypothetical protein Q8L27_02845 [archaeon]|nr:hypothetical protein [archaeon]
MVVVISKIQEYSDDSNNGGGSSAGITILENTSLIIDETPVITENPAVLDYELAGFEEQEV